MSKLAVVLDCKECPHRKEYEPEKRRSRRSYFCRIDPKRRDVYIRVPDWCSLPDAPK